MVAILLVRNLRLRSRAYYLNPLASENKRQGNRFALHTHNIIHTRELGSSLKKCFVSKDSEKWNQALHTHTHTHKHPARTSEGSERYTLVTSSPVHGDDKPSRRILGRRHTSLRTNCGRKKSALLPARSLFAIGIPPLFFAAAALSSRQIGVRSFFAADVGRRSSSRQMRSRTFSSRQIMLSPK